MIDLPWDPISTAPRREGELLLLFEPGFGFQIGHWDEEAGCFVSPERTYLIPLKLGQLRSAGDALGVRKVPIRATLWARANISLPDDAADAPRSMANLAKPTPSFPLRLVHSEDGRA